MQTLAPCFGGNTLLRLFIILLVALSDVHTTSSSSSSVVTNLMKNRSTPRNRVNLQASVEISRKFACKDPQPRAYNLRDLMQNLNLQNPSESSNQPVYMVVKRCDSHSGCCMSPDMVCTPVINSTYYEDVEIEVWSLVTNDTRRQWIRVEQHSKCTCEVTNLGDRERLESQNPNVTILR